MKKKSLIFIIVYLAYTSIYIARLNLSVAAPEFYDLALLDSSKVGVLGAVFSVVFAIGRLINGSLSDKQPPWIMISTGLVIAGISNIVFGFFPPYIGMLMLWMANAFAQSMLWSSVLCVVSSLYEPVKAKKMVSYMVTSVATGNIIGIILNTFIISKFGLRFAFIIPGCITLILSSLVFFSINKIKAPNANSSMHVPVYRLLEKKEIKLTMIPTLLHGIMKDNVSFWMVAYFVASFAVDLKQSALFVLFIPVIGLIGRILYPLCSKLCGHNEHKISALGFIICAAAAIPLSLGTVTPVVAAVCLSLIYAAASVINTALVSIFPIRYLDSGNVASLSGVLDLATYLGAGIGSFIYGYVIEAVGYSPMFISWGAISVFSIIILIKLAKNK